MNVFGITRIRNEEQVIKNTLDHVANLVDGVVVYDDCSTDNTVQICQSHSIVKRIIKGSKWDPTPRGRNKAEGTLRQGAYMAAVALGADWVYCFDADEYAEFVDIDYCAGTYYFRLFDFYITEEDKNADYTKRKWMGPEYRDIPMMFKVNDSIYFSQRIPRGMSKPLVFGGYVRHYGKAISVEAWEEACKYYTEHRWLSINPELHKRWEGRKGLAIHSMSDFGRPLITWEDRFNEGEIVKI